MPPRYQRDDQQYLEGPYRVQIENIGASIAELLEERGIRAGTNLGMLGEEPERQAHHLRYSIHKIVAPSKDGPIVHATEHNCRRDVAVKVLRTHTATDDELTRFLREGHITSQLDHPGVLPVHELSIDRHGNAFMAMKLVDGDPLDVTLAKIRSGDKATIAAFPLTRLLQIFLRVCDAVSYAHNEGVIHCDIRPTNILVGTYNEVHLMHWADAYQLDRPVDQVGGNRHPLRQRPLGQDAQPEINPGRASNQYGFIAPEQIRDEPVALDARTDIYGLGGLLYSILTLRPPIEGASQIDIFHNIIEAEVTDPEIYSEMSRQAARRHVGDPENPVLYHCPKARIPESLAAAALKALAKSPAERFRSISKLRAEVEAWQREFARKSDTTGFHVDVLRFIKRHRLKTVIAGVVAILLLAVAAGIYVFASGKSATADSDRAAAEAQRTNAQAKLAEVEPLGNDAPPPVTAAAAPFWDIARRTVHNAVEAAPDSPVNHFLLGQYYLAQLEFQQARSHFLNVRKHAEPDSLLSRHALRFLIGLSASKGPRELPEPPPEESGPKTVVTDQPSIVTWNPEDIDSVRLALKKEFEKRNPAFTLAPDALTVTDEKIEFRVFQAPNLVDISPLAGLPLTELVLYGTNVTSIDALKGMHLSAVNLFQASVLSDISPLAGMPLISLDLTETAVADLSPLAGSQLRALYLDNTPVTDLSPLQGLPLTALGLNQTRVKKIDALAGMPLKTLSLSRTYVSDIAPLKGMPLEAVALAHTGISSIDALAGAPIKSLLLNGTHVRDISPLAEAPLETLNLAGCPMREITALAGLPLRRLWLHDCSRLRSLQPLAECLELQQLTIPENAHNILFLKELTTLTHLSRSAARKPVAKFWEAEAQAPE
jgi:serine/threonine protein kinase